MVGENRAPGFLWLLGEQGVQYIGTAKRYEAAVKRLFPEARVVVTPGWERGTDELIRLNETLPGYYMPTPYDR